MKQNITPKQLEEISHDAREKLRQWWEPEFGDRFIQPSFPKGDMYDDFLVIGQCYLDQYLGVNPKTAKAYPLMSIGQMVEFIDDHSNNDWDIELGNTPMVIQCEELCDALWKAVKERLEKEA